MKSALKSDADTRLAKIAGQITGLQKMVTAERPCSDILQQIVAVRSALDQLGVSFLTDHLQTCVLHRDMSTQQDCCKNLPEEQWDDEIKSTLRRFLK